MTQPRIRDSAKPLAQSSAYEACLQLAARQHWNSVYSAMQEDGFDKRMDYVGLLELWRMDSAGELT